MRTPGEKTDQSRSSQEEIIRNFQHSGFRRETLVNNKFYEKLRTEGFKNFYVYLNCLGIPKDKDLIILPPAKHYYYEAEDLKDIKIVVNLKELNEISELTNFFNTIFHNLQPGSYFMGYFFDNKNQNEVKKDLRTGSKASDISDFLKDTLAIKIPFLNMMLKIMDIKSKRYLTKRTVTSLLEDADLKVLDMTELEGLTYFCSQKAMSA